jgi:site-specific DNA-cytosine methylase
MTREITLLENIDLKSMQFRVNELEHFIANRPNYTKVFNFNLDELNGKEIIILLKADLNYLYQIDFKDKNGIRKITPVECARIQGFPDRYKLPQIADSALYKQFGNSVSVPVIEAIAKQMMKAMNNP